MTNLHDDTGPQLDAGLRLQTAIDQLTQPGVERLDRARADTDTAVRADRDHDHTRRQAELERDARIDADLRRKHAQALAHGKAGQAAARRTMDQLLQHGARVRADATRWAEREAARTAAVAPLPSLLDQLTEAVASSAGGGTKRGRTVHRSIIGLDAAELLGHIQRAVGHRSGDLADDLRAWAVRHDSGPAAAALAEQWVTDARAILDPDRTTGIRGGCPICHTRRVRVADDQGETVWRAAIQVSHATKTARCVAPGCTGRWTEHYLGHLASVIEQDVDEREERRRARRAG